MSKKSKQVIHMCKSMEQTKNVLLLFSEQRPMQSKKLQVLSVSMSPDLRMSLITVSLTIYTHGMFMDWIIIKKLLPTFNSWTF